MSLAGPLKYRLLSDSSFGVEIDRDLRSPLTPEEEDHLRRLYEEHYLLVFRGQADVTMEVHEQLMRPLGKLLPGDFHVVSNVRADGQLGASALAFHSDNSYAPEPVQGISLYAVDLVDGASSTRFANNVTALAALPAELRRLVADLCTAHVMVSYLSGERDLENNLTPDRPRTIHPMVLEHPKTGVELLFVTELASAWVEGLGAEEGEELLQALFGYLYNPSNVYEHRWHRGDLLIWDNIALQHARGDLSQVGDRTLQRMSIGTKDFFEQFSEDIGSSIGNNPVGTLRN